MPYQDEKGHFTTRENDGGPCNHESPDGEPKAKKTIRGGRYLIGDREVTRDEWDAHDGPDEEMDATTDEDFELFDEYELSTKEGLEKAEEFVAKNGVTDPYALSNEEFNALAKKAQEEFGIKDLSLAQEFIVAPFDEKKEAKEEKPEPKKEEKPSPAETKKAKTEEKARKLVSSRTDGQLVQLFDLTEIMPSNQETATVRGWIMDELKKRNPKAFDEWLESEEDSPSGFFGKGE